MNDGSKVLFSGLMACLLVGLMSFFVLVVNKNESNPVTAKVDASMQEMDMDIPALTSDQVESAYSDILENYRNHTGDINENFDKDLHYAFVDIMEDGYPECVIARVDDNGYKIVDLFGFDGYQTKRLCTLPGKKVNIKLLKNGLVYEANRSESIKYNAFYQLMPYSTDTSHQITFYSRHSTYWIKENDNEKEEVTKEEYNSKGYPYQSLDILEDIEWTVIDS